MADWWNRSGTIVERSSPSEMKGGGLSATLAVASPVMGSTDAGPVADTLSAEHFRNEDKMQDAQWGYSFRR